MYPAWCLEMVAAGYGKGYSFSEWTGLHWMVEERSVRSFKRGMDKILKWVNVYMFTTDKPPFFQHRFTFCWFPALCVFSCISCRPLCCLFTLIFSVCPVLMSFLSALSFLYVKLLS